MRKAPEFRTEDRKHWPIIEAYKAKKISRAQAVAQLRDIGMVDAWEHELYLDDDQSCEED